MNIEYITAFSDNYIWLIIENKKVIVVDPGEEQNLLSYLNQHQYELIAVLITHHHHDHTGGLKKIIQTYPHVPIYGNQHSKITDISHPLKDKDTFSIAQCNHIIDVITVPGHTLDHLCFVINNALFCGDTVFSGGCGRIFEGSPEQMLQSVNRIKQYPDDYLIYCAHEYTLNNLKFALTLEPNNIELQQHFLLCQEKKKKHEPTIPTTIALEKKINPFFRLHEKEIQQNLIKLTEYSVLNTDLEIFTAIRNFKNIW